MSTACPIESDDRDSTGFDVVKVAERGIWGRALPSHLPSSPEYTKKNRRRAVAVAFSVGCVSELTLICFAF